MFNKSPYQLEEPIIPVAYMHDLFVCNGAEFLMNAISKGGDGEVMLTLFNAIMFTTSYEKEAQEKNGRVAAGMNQDATEVLITGLQALHKLGAFG